MEAGLRSLVPGSDSYTDLLTAERADQDRFREESPWLAMGAEVAGAIPTGLVLPGLAAAKLPSLGTSLIPRMATGLGLGALEGAGYGYATGEGCLLYTSDAADE